MAVLKNLDEGDEEVVHALAELLDVGVLVGRALVAVDRDPLVHRAALAVEFLAEGLHHELLEVAGEEEQPVLVRKDDHVLGAASVRREMPHEGQQGGGIGRGHAPARKLVHRRGSREEGVDLDPLEGGGQEADRAEFARPASDPVPHGEAGEPALADRRGIELRSGAGDRHEVLRDLEAGGLERRGRLEHAVSGLGCSARFRDDDDQRLAEAAADVREHGVDAVRIRVVEEVDGHLVAGAPEAAERLADELGPEGRAADPDHEQFAEFSGGSGDFPPVDLSGEFLDRREGRGDLMRQLRGRRELRRAQPVVADPAILVGVRDRPALEGVHLGEGLLHRRFHRGDEAVRKRDPADVEGESQRGILKIVFLESGPGHG